MLVEGLKSLDRVSRLLTSFPLFVAHLAGWIISQHWCGDRHPIVAVIIKQFDTLRAGFERRAAFDREAFGAWLPIWGVPASYAVAIGYVLTDTADKGNKAYKEARLALVGNDKLHPEVNTPR